MPKDSKKNEDPSEFAKFVVKLTDEQCAALAGVPKHLIYWLFNVGLNTGIDVAVHELVNPPVSQHKFRLSPSGSVIKRVLEHRVTTITRDEI